MLAHTKIYCVFFPLLSHLLISFSPPCLKCKFSIFKFYFSTSLMGLLIEVEFMILNKAFVLEMFQNYFLCISEVGWSLTELSISVNIVPFCIILLSAILTHEVVGPHRVHHNTSMMCTVLLMRHMVSCTDFLPIHRIKRHRTVLFRRDLLSLLTPTSIPKAGSARAGCSGSCPVRF